jgi:lysophospholipase L1-like esterase
MIRSGWLKSLADFFSPINNSRRSRFANSPYRPGIEGLEDRSMPAALTTIATLGDSLTAAYPSNTPRGIAGDQSWVQQLQAQGYHHLAIDNLAVSGATSADIFTDGQVATAAHLISTGNVQYASLIIGANDVISPTFLPEIMGGVTQPFVTMVTTNIETALTQLESAAASAHEPLGLTVGTIPDVGVTPAMQYELTQQLGVPLAALPTVLHNITTATVQANNVIESFAAHHGIPVVDMYGLGQLGANAATTPVIVGGHSFTNLYAPDSFHPSTVGQGLLANAVLEALAAPDSPRLERFSLSDQQILTNANIPHGEGRTYFDVDPYVLYQPPHEDGHEHHVGRDDDISWGHSAGDDGLAQAADEWLGRL